MAPIRNHRKCQADRDSPIRDETAQPDLTLPWLLPQPPSLAGPSRTSPSTSLPNRSLIAPAAEDIIIPPQRSSKSHSHKKSENHIKRPRNAFILYRSWFVHNRIGVLTVEKKHQNVSCIASTCWNSLTEEEKSPWLAFAAEEQKVHRETFPDYRFKPHKNRLMRKRENPASDSWKGLADLLIKGKGSESGEQGQDAVKAVPKVRLRRRKRAARTPSPPPQPSPSPRPSPPSHSPCSPHPAAYHSPTPLPSTPPPPARHPSPELHRRLVHHSPSTPPAPIPLPEVQHIPGIHPLPRLYPIPPPYPLPMYLPLRTPPSQQFTVPELYPRLPRPQSLPSVPTPFPSDSMLPGQAYSSSTNMNSNLRRQEMFVDFNTSTHVVTPYHNYPDPTSTWAPPEYPSRYDMPSDEELLAIERGFVVDKSLIEELEGYVRW